MDNNKYIFTPEKGRIFDFFFMLNKYMGYNCPENEPNDFNLLNKDILNSYNKITKNIKKDTLGLSLFFKMDEKGDSLFTSLLTDTFVEADTIIEILNIFRNYDINSIIIKTFLFFDKKNNFSDKFYNIIIQNRELLIEYLKGLKLSYEIKWEIINFIDIGEGIKEELYQLLYKLSLNFETEYELNKNNINEYYDKVKNKLETSDDSRFSDFKYMLENYKSINICVSLFLPCTIKYLSSKNNILNVYLGYGYEKGIKTDDYVILNNIDFFKAFTDKTRIKILDLIKKEELSAGEIAEKLEINNSTLSHHLDILCEANILSRDIRGKKSFFNIEKEHILKVIKILGSFSE